MSARPCRLLPPTRPARRRETPPLGTRGASPYQGALYLGVLFLGVLFLAAATCLAPAAHAADGAEQTTPVKPKNGKWRIGYMEGGPYVDYQDTLKATVAGLAELGWMEPMDLPATTDAGDTRGVWNALATDAKSDYLEFPKDAFWTSDWDKARRAATLKTVVAALKAGKVDLVIAMGTWAGQDLADAPVKTPIEVLSTSDPIKAGIVTSPEDSGHDNLHALVDATRFQRQVELFHDIIGFRTLGITFEDTVEGRSYAAVSDVEKVAAERGFKIVSCLTKNNVPDVAEAEASVIACHKELADKVDAVYITVQRGVNSHSLPALLAPLTAHSIPTFSQAGSKEVKEGVLLSISKAGMVHPGRFHARAIAAMLRGTKPRALSMIFEHPPTIAINLAEAEAIGFDPPMDLLSAADEIYDSIGGK
ncbi:MAG: ABC transporter substrate-binding protein [Desulfovibrionaceae bacterium]|jgi:ABC-type uncharacterized transport system substrate-binding protein|nr:ABC transporter substrate-binding protein [Desulfovibrionaceae bacterium]